MIDTGTAVTLTDVDATDFNGGTLTITTTSGAADGSFSLDSVNATSGGDNIILANETITVGATTIGTVHATNDGQNGHTLAIALNSNATTANVSELIRNIDFESTTVGLRNFNLALSENNSATSNVAFSVNVQAAPSSGGGSGTTSFTVDGVTVNTTVTNSGSTTVTTTTVPTVTASRTEDTTTPYVASADIPLVADNTGKPIILASLPVGIGLTSQTIGGSSALTLREHLIAASHPKINTDQVFNDILQEGIDKYVETVRDEGQVTVRTITFTAGTGGQAIHDPIILTGALGTGENDLNNPLRQEALVIDTRNLPTGTTLQLNNVEFAIIVGGGRFVGGNGNNFVVADGADQFIVLGAGDDMLHGGDGNIGSRGGNDQLFGDKGNDHLVGGEGNDVLNGGDGNDLLQGDASNAGNITFSLDGQGRHVLSTLHPLDLALTDSVSTNWYSGDDRITNDDRVAFVYRDMNQLKTISTLYQAVTHRLPTTEEMNDWSAQNLSALQAGQIAYDHYLSVLGDMTHQAIETQLSRLIDFVWGAGNANDDLVNTGIEFLNNGGSWNEILLYLVNHENLTNQLSDADGNLQLTQNLAISEIGLSLNSGNDTLYGGSGDDVLAGGYGHNVIDGGDGVDTVHMVETLSTHHIALTKAGLISIARNDGQAINDLQGIEKVVFSDQTLNINFANLDAQALKQVASVTHLMDQDADLWTQLNQFASSNLTIGAYSQSLMQTSSYQEHWAAQSNREFVTELSEIVLGQPLTGDSLNYWTNQLDQNLSQRSDLFVIAANNTEYQNTLFPNDGLILL